MKPAKGTVCPKCMGKRSLALESRPLLVRCVKCGEVRHYTHWKTLHETKQQVRRVKDLASALDAAEHAETPEEIERIVEWVYGEGSMEKR